MKSGKAPKRKSPTIYGVIGTVNSPRQKDHAQVCEVELIFKRPSNTARSKAVGVIGRIKVTLSAPPAKPGDAPDIEEARATIKWIVAALRAAAERDAESAGQMTVATLLPRLGLPTSTKEMTEDQQVYLILFTQIAEALRADPALTPAAFYARTYADVIVDGTATLWAGLPESERRNMENLFQAVRATVGPRLPEAEGKRGGR